MFQGAKWMNTKIVDQVAKIINGNVGADDLVQIERIVQKAKKEIETEIPLGYWQDKTPCWTMNSCPAIIRQECPSHRIHSHPCWEMEGTYCKFNDHDLPGRDTSICNVCRVYKVYGGNQKIEIKLFSHGIGPVFLKHLKDEN
jgi:hypothetical protein